jgi:hypothetical protein
MCYLLTLAGWDKKPGVKILFGRWQDCVASLEPFDAVFFDTFGEFYDDLKEFHTHLPRLLKPDGTYSYFNGLAASTNVSLPPADACLTPNTNRASSTT